MKKLSNPQDPKSEQMLDGLIEAALSSPLKSSFEPMYRQLQAMRMDRQAFVITSVIGKTSSQRSLLSINLIW